MLSRRTPIEAPGDTCVPRSFGPRCSIVSVIASRTPSASTCRGSPRIWIAPHIPHISWIHRRGVARRPRHANDQTRSASPDQTARFGGKRTERNREGTEVTSPAGPPTAREDRVGEGTKRDTQAHERYGRAAVVLRRVPDSAGGEDRQQARTRRGSPSLVRGGDGRHEPDVVSGRPDTRAEIDVLAVVEEALVEPSDVLEHRSTDEQARPRYPLDRVCPLVR